MSTFLYNNNNDNNNNNAITQHRLRPSPQFTMSICWSLSLSKIWLAV